jgi:long-chain acyl-CoA synthetase
MLSHDNLIFNALNALIVSGYNANSLYLHAAPMFHMADATSVCGLTMVQGTHVFIPKYDPETTLRVIAAEKITNVTLVPTMINMLVNFSRVADYDLSTLKRIWYGASSMPMEIMKKSMEIIPDCQFAQSYGMTELSPLATILEEKYHQLENPSQKMKSVGKAVPAVEMRIVDEKDQEVPRNIVGEVVVRGDNVMLGYWNRPQDTAKAVRDGWMRTQDAGYMDEDGFIYITDRMKDMIISGGENIYSTEVENKIYEHPAVESCAVIGIPDDKWGEKVHAIVDLKKSASATEEELITFCKERLAGYKCPRSVSFQREPFPLSGAGKILKSKLREPYWMGKEKQVN